jgi:phosphomevalonate kinase
MQASACGDMQRYADSIGESTRVVIRKPATSHTHQSRPAGVRVAVNDCEAAGYGSIRYRRCRAAEKKRLHGKCLRFKARMNQVQGAEYRRLKPWREAYCIADARYVVVR